jgi:DNA-binding NarL/FixJ family response regulator
MSPTTRALIVEDDPSWQAILSELLQDAGMEVDLTSSLDEASITLHQRPHRLAVVDLSLAGSDYQNMDGLRVLDTVRKLDPGCQTLLLTGFATVELAVSAITKHGAITCLRKETFRRSQFRELVSRVLSNPGPLAVELNAFPTATTVSPASGDPVTLVRDLTPAASTPSTRRPVLLVEDDAGWRAILAEILTGAGYAPRLCSGFAEALGYLRREKFKLAVVDLTLSMASQSEAQVPEGFRLLAAARSANTPTIVVSGIAAPQEIERAYADFGVFAYIEKQSFNRPAFLNAVSGACEASGASSQELDILTEREREVLGMLARGLTNKEIAESLFISSNTVKRHLKAVFEKLGIHTRSAAAAIAIAAGLAPPLSLGRAAIHEEE